MSVLFAMIRTSSERIRRLSAQLVVYDEVGKAIGEARDLQTLLDVILQQLSSATYADWGMVLLRSQFSELPRSSRPDPLGVDRRAARSRHHWQWFPGTMLGGIPVDRLVSNFDDEEPFRSCARLGFETASLLVSPITLEGRLLGLIVLGGVERGHFDLNALNLVRGVGRQASQAILNARYREEEQARSRHSRQFVRF